MGQLPYGRADVSYQSGNLQLPPVGLLAGCQIILKRSRIKLNDETTSQDQLLLLASSKGCNVHFLTNFGTKSVDPCSLMLVWSSRIVSARFRIGIECESAHSTLNPQSKAKLSAQ